MAETEFKYDVFLSHNSKDKTAVEKIARILRDEYHLKIWLDKWNLTPGKDSQEELEEGLENSETIAIFLGEAGFGKWENKEMRAAVNSHINDSSRRVIPVFLPGAPEKSKLSAFLGLYTWVDLRAGFDTKDSLYLLYCGITGQVPGDYNPSKPVAPGSRDTWNLAHPYPMPPNFTGRGAEQQMLNDWLADDKDRLFILRALGGFGKSALAWQWINSHVNPAEWTKLVWWSFYEGDASFEHFIEETLKYLKLEVPQGQRPQVDELLKAMQGQKILLIMDGFERALRAYSSMNAAYQEDIESPLPEGEGKGEGESNQLDCMNINAEIFLKSVCSLPNIKSKVLMTTRLTPRAVKPHGEIMLGCGEEELTAMQPADAVEFFRKQKIKGTHAEIESACEPYGYHPLSLRILAGLVIDDREKPGDIEVAKKLDITDDIVANKNHVLKIAYDTISTEQQKLLSTIACFRAPMTYDTLKSISSKPSGKSKKPKVVSTKKLDDDLKVLEKRGLLHWDRETNKYDLHPIVRRYAYARLSTHDLTAAHTRLIDYFKAVPEREKIEKLEDLAPVIELYHHMVRAEKLDEASVLFRDRLHNQMFYQLGAYQIYAELLQALFLDGEDKLPRLKNERAQAWITSSLANAYASSGQPRRAVPLFEAQQKLLQKNSDKENLARSLINFADMIQIGIGTFRFAESNLRLGFELSVELQNEFTQAIFHNTLGRLLAYSGAWDEAKLELETSRTLFKNQNYIIGQSITWSYEVLCEFLMKRAGSSGESPRKYAEHSFLLANEWAKTKYPIEIELVRTNWLIGASYRLEENIKIAESYLSEALTRDRAINNVEFEADILLDLARLRYDQKNFEEAKSLVEEALSITERCGYVLQGADVNLFLAQYALEQEKDKAKAKEYAETALKLATCDGPPYYYKVAYDEAERMLAGL